MQAQLLLFPVNGNITGAEKELSLKKKFLKTSLKLKANNHVTLTPKISVCVNFPSSRQVITSNCLAFLFSTGIESTTLILLEF